MQKHVVVLRLLGQGAGDLFISVCIAGEHLAHPSSIPTQLSFRDLPDVRARANIKERSLFPADLLFCLAVPTSSAVLAIISRSLVLRSLPEVNKHALVACWDTELTLLVV